MNIWKFSPMDCVMTILEEYSLYFHHILSTKSSMKIQRLSYKKTIIQNRDEYYKNPVRKQLFIM